MTNTTSTFDVQSESQELLVPRTLVIQLQKQPEFRNWVKSAQVIGDRLRLFLHEFVDGQRIPQRITVDDFRNKFQIAVADCE